MSGPTSQAMWDTITRLNWHFGRGEIASIAWHGGAEIIVKVRLPGIGFETRKARMLDSGHVRFRGHVRKVQTRL